MNGIKKRISATFIGEDGSVGYRNGERYELDVAGSYGSIVISRRPDGDGFCPYSTIVTFLDNWTDIHNLESDLELV